MPADGETPGIMSLAESAASAAVGADGCRPSVGRGVRARTARPAALEPLTRELDAWARRGAIATFWWRDDDASGVRPGLDLLLELRRETDVPLSLAVIPADLEEGLAPRLAAEDAIVVVQHGYAHANHARPDEKKAELASGRSHAEVLDELIAGGDLLRAAFPKQFAPVLAPPWNRIAAEYVSLLPGIGLTGLTSFGTRSLATPAPRLRLCNCHVDIVDWRGNRDFVGWTSAVDQTVAHLAARREDRVDAGEATGLLTHHLDHDEGCWDFVRAFLALTRAHPAARWVDVETAMGPGS
ncbi:MAG: polysaccharide deacetylase family protein [Rhodospirillales bacterium]|jgi:hypothetical protein|nr:polysaccharide deacetylase family protein [Rhodospirillales bacterium]MDP6805253.1 polysaccharide deacetylase family protein [Rhodospirillales bacterium]